MQRPRDGNVSVEMLAARLRALEERVSELEHARGIAGLGIVAPSGAALHQHDNPDVLASGAAAFIGRALLGIAGAYVLRAIAESGILPQLVLALASLAYAAIWLAWSARIGSRERLGMAVYATTASLIVAPMLWETTVRFHVMPAQAAAAALSAFVLAGTLLARWRGLAGLAGITTTAAVLTCLTLLIATRELIPFTVALLTIAAITEAARFRAWLPAAAVDTAVLVLIRIVTRPQGIPEGYAPFAITAVFAVLTALLVIYAASTIYETVVRRAVVAFWPSLQLAAVLLLSVGGAIAVAPAMKPVLSIFCIAAGAACYTAAFLRFRDSSTRNFHVYGAFGCALLLWGAALAPFHLAVAP